MSRLFNSAKMRNVAQQSERQRGSTPVMSRGEQLPPEQTMDPLSNFDREQKKRRSPTVIENTNTKGYGL